MYESTTNPLYKNATPNDREAARAKDAAEKLGRICVYPQESELFIDIDSVEAFGRLQINRRILSELGLFESSSDSPSPSGKTGHYHVTIKLTRPVRDALERVCLQALLGSDLTREALAYVRASQGASNATVFFEKPAPQYLAITPAVPSPDDDLKPEAPAATRPNSIGGDY